MLSDLFSRLRGLFHSDVVDVELDGELRLHLDREDQKYPAWTKKTREFAN